jgi:hypothetical protein
MGFVHPGVVEILNFDTFEPLKSCWGGYIIFGLTHLERQAARLYGVDTGHIKGEKTCHQ